MLSTMASSTNQLIRETTSVTPWPRKIYHTDSDFWKDSKDLHYAYIIYRTLRGDYARIFKPDAVFYVCRSPAAYLKKVRTNKISEADVRDWQRFLWNQAVVPMLIVQSRTQIHVYTAYTQPKERDSTERIQAILEDTVDALELDQIWTAIEAGTLYEEKPEAFRRSQAVDRFLLDNLNVAARKLSATQRGGITQKNLEFAHRFLTRLLFICYLIERGMIGEHFNNTEHKILKKLQPASENKKGYFLRHLFNDLSTYPKKKEALCRIFGYVKRRFNGSLFPETIEEEKSRYSKEFIQIVDDFLQGHDLETGQMTLGFWAYDFSVIPIETISSVYQSFLGEQGKIEELRGGKDSQRTTGAYYTPLHLAELTVDMALENITKPIH
jgi:hypothetical protein